MTPREPITAPALSASLRLCALLAIIFMGMKATAAEGALGNVFIVPPPCAPLCNAGFWILDFGFWPAVADLDVKGMSLGGLGLAATLLGYHFIFARYIRQQAGVKDSTNMTISDQPIQVQGVVRFVAHHELDERLGGYVTGQALHDAEKRIDHKIDENFRELDKKRSASIGTLHQHLTGQTHSLTEKIAHGDSRTHDRVDALAQQVGVLIGETRALAITAADAARIAHESAIAAARAGRKA